MAMLKWQQQKKYTQTKQATAKRNVPPRLCIKSVPQSGIENIVKELKYRNGKMMWGLFDGDIYFFFYFFFLCKAIIPFKLPAFIAFDLNCSAIIVVVIITIPHGRGSQADLEAKTYVAGHAVGYLFESVALGSSRQWSFVHFGRCHGAVITELTADHNNDVHRHFFGAWNLVCDEVETQNKPKTKISGSSDERKHVTFTDFLTAK